MKRVLILGTIVISLLVISCSKKSSETVYPITGLWVGTYTTTDIIQDTLYFAFNIQPDSTIINQVQGSDGVTYYSYGTWLLSGNSFSSSCTTLDGFGGNNSGVTETTSATFDNIGKLTGTWKTIYHTGTFSLVREN